MILLIVPVFEITRWIRVARDVNEGQAERVAAYLAPLPSLLQDTFYHTLVLLGFSLFAVFFSLRALDAKGVRKYIGILVLGVATLIATWLVFTLM